MFRIVVKMDREAQPSGGETSINPAILDLLWRGFVATQVLRIRRLCEKNPDSAEKAVVSLRRAIDEVQSSSDVITRENFVAHDGTPYTSDRDEEHPETKNPNAEDDRLISYTINSQRPSPSRGSEDRHKIFDVLSMTHPGHRCRCDTIHRDVLCTLKERLGACSDVSKWASGVIAHAPDPTERKRSHPRLPRVTWDRVCKCHKAAYETALLVYRDVLLGPRLPEPLVALRPADPNLPDKPWTSTETLPKLLRYWTRRVESLRRWNQVTWEQLGLPRRTNCGS